jgi:hypothetical protein
MAAKPSECRYIMTNGERCESPALRGTNYCYFHSRLMRIRRDRRVQETPFTLPDLEDAGAIQLALSQVASGVAAGKLGPEQASVLLRVFRFASDNLRQSAKFASRNAVNAVSDSGDGEQIASD